MNLAGQTLSNRYQLGALLGAGGFGQVYEARDLETGQPVAIKTLLPGLEGARDVVGRFEREAKVGGFLDHPNIVDVHAMGALPDGTLYLVMELVRGKSVGKLLDDGPLPPQRALAIARQALEAVAYAHTHGLVHRDLKPENVMLVSQTGPTGQSWEQVKLLDFGLVKVMGLAAEIVGNEKLTKTGTVSGTPAYMAPEQILGRPVDHRADLYALGVLVFNMVTGNLPYYDPDPRTLMRMHLAADVPRIPFASRELQALVDGALAKKPDQRFARAGDMIRVLDAAFAVIP